ncbi:MAG: outer membrane beta-barrel family protein [Chitinophagaceae bacterium]
MNNKNSPMIYFLIIVRLLCMGNLASAQQETKKIDSLQEVKVTARKPIIKQEIDRISYDLQADPESKGNSVLEMMRKVPYLSLDADDNILLKGNSSYKIFINGKPSGLMERNPKEVLRSMPASTIQRIEVITNPPAKYDAEGLAGIINIITNKKIDNGYNGSLNINERYPVGGPGLGTSFSVKEGKFGISGYGGASLYISPKTNNSISRITNGNNETDLQRNGIMKSDSRSGYFGTDFSYEIDSINLISGQVNLNGSNSDGYSKQRSVLNGKNSLLQAFDLQNDNDGKGYAIDGALNYQLGFKTNKSKLLTFSYRYMKYTGEQNNILLIANPVNYTMPNYRQANNTFSDEHTMQIDYVQQWKKIGIEAGIKGILRNNNSDYQYLSFNAANGTFETDISQANQFNYNQNIFGAYNTYQYSSGNWNVKAGVRIEQTDINADFISTLSKVKQHYFNIIPSIAIKRRLKNNASLNFGFTQRIKRPGINRLNPFVDRSNPNFESTGNPGLRPVLNNRFQFAYSISDKLSFNTGLDYTYVNNIDLKVSYFDPVTNITRSTYENTGKANAFDYSINASYPITKKWSASINGTLTYISIQGIVNKILIKDDWLLYNVSTSTGYRFNKGWRVNASLNINSPNPTSLQGTSNGMVNSSFSVNKEVVKDKLSFTAGLTNPFTKYRHNIIKTWGTDFMEIIDNRNYFRSCSVSLNYNFGKLKQAIKKNMRGINNDDISGGKGL